jgi:hypothetical protein
LFNRLALGSIEAAAAISGAKLDTEKPALLRLWTHSAELRGDTNDTKSSARDIPTIPERFRLTTSGANAWRKPMHYIVSGLAIFAAVLAIVFVTGNLPPDANASHNDSNYTAIR